LLLALLALISVTSADHQAQTFVVNLDLPPEDRWPW